MPEKPAIRRAPLRNWVRRNREAFKSLLRRLPQFIQDPDDVREYQPPSKPRLIWGFRESRSIYTHQPPDLHCTVQDGMGEHYGYPRHSLYLRVWWKRTGYAFGVVWMGPTQDERIEWAKRFQDYDS